MPLIDSKGLTATTQFTPVTTETGNNSPYHAIFGLSTGDKYVHQSVTDLAAKKKNIANNIKSIDSGSHRLFPSVSEAIVHLIRQGNVVILDKNNYPTLFQHQENFIKDPNSIPTSLTKAAIDEYALLMEKGDRPLFFQDIEVIAHAYTMTNDTGISIDFYQSDTIGTVTKKTFNAGNPQTGMLYLNNNSYQAVIENHGSFTTKLAKINHDKPYYLTKGSQYDAAGLKPTLHGVIYQLKLLMHFAMMGSQDHRSFLISTERNSAEKFDDVEFKSTSAGEKETYDFVQAKHKQDASEVVTDSKLLNTKDGEFSLTKYFLSYKNIKNNPTYHDGTIGNIYLCTNIDLDPKTKFTFNKMTGPDRLLDTSTPGEARYRIDKDPLANKDLYDHFKKNTEGYQLAHKIVNYIAKGKKITLSTPMFKDHQANLANAGIIKSGEFTSKFIEGKIKNPAWVNQFRQLLIDAAPNKQSASKTHSADANTLKFLFKDMKASNSFGKKNTSPLVNLEMTVPDTEIEEFFDHLVLAVKQADEVQLGEVIAKGLGDQFNLMDGNFVYAELEKAMLDWMKTKEGHFVDQKAITDFFTEVRTKLSRFALIGSTLDFQEKCKQANITFSPDTTVSHFLTNTTKQLLVCETPGDAFLSSVQVYQTIMSKPEYAANDSCVFVSLEKAKRIADLVEGAKLDSKRLLVITCKKEISGSDLDFMATLFSQIKSKMIIIANKDHTSILHHSSLNSNIYIAKNNFDSLSSESKVKILNQKIRFQGSDTQLNQIVNKIDTAIDAQALMDIAHHKETSIEIGDSLPQNQSYLIPRQINLVDATKPKANINLITAEPGMGKTFSVSHYISAEKAKNGKLWAIPIDLSAHLLQHKLANLKSPIDKESMITFFVGDNAPPLARKVFNEKLENGDLMISLDSFDVIPTHLQTKLIELLTLLKDTKAQVFIPGTIKEKAILEKNLGGDLISSHQLEPFDAISFLDKYLPIALTNSKYSGDPTQFINEAKQFFLNLQEAKAYLGNPLHLKLLIDYSVDHATKQNVPFPTLYEMHRHFIATRYDVCITRLFAEEARQSPFFPTYISGITSKVQLMAELPIQHQDCAFNTVFPQFKVQSTMQYTLHRNDPLLQEVGFIQFDKIHQLPQFTDKSFEKFLAAEFIFTMLGHNNQLLFEAHYQPFLIKQIFQENYKEVREFLENMLNDSPDRKEAWDKMVQSHSLPAGQKMMNIQPDSSLNITPFNVELAKNWNTTIIQSDQLSLWANHLLEQIILPVLNELAKNPKLSLLGFMEVCNYVFHNLMRADPPTPIKITTTQITSLLKLIEKELNFNPINDNLLFSCSNLLYSLNKMGLLIINTESALLIQSADGEFEYELDINLKAIVPQEKLFNLLKNNTTPNMTQLGINGPLFAPDDPLREASQKILNIQNSLLRPPVQRAQSDIGPYRNNINLTVDSHFLVNKNKRQKLNGATDNTLVSLPPRNDNTKGDF